MGEGGKESGAGEEGVAASATGREGEGRGQEGGVEGGDRGARMGEEGWARGVRCPADDVDVGVGVFWRINARSG